ncbi:MAG: hypothetical protein LUC83_07010 [Clostridiales bacterium]|nr:hypothetical protein [Clostridiales bacterium]
MSENTDTKAILEKRPFQCRDKERASQILDALEGLSIREALDLLDACKSALEYVTVSFLSAQKEEL